MSQMQRKEANHLGEGDCAPGLSCFVGLPQHKNTSNIELVLNSGPRTGVRFPFRIRYSDSYKAERTFRDLAVVSMSLSSYLCLCNSADRHDL